jgi:PAS domain S-box-containing protein
VLTCAILGGVGFIAFTLRARRRAEQAMSSLASIVESSNDAIIGKSLDGTILSWNRGAERLYGYRADEVVGRSISILVPSDRQDEVPGILGRIAEGQPVEHLETVRMRKDGRRLDVSLTVSPTRDPSGRIIGASTIARDITERRRAEETVRRAREEAERASRAKSDFLSSMSHELRTPLNAILGFGQLLEDDEDLGTDHRESAAFIVQAGRHLLDLINEILDIARIETGRLSLSVEPVPVSDVLRESLSLIRPLAAERRLSITAELSTVDGRAVMADRQRFKQVLLNLLSNAVKYNREDGSVRVSVGEARDGVLRFEIEDTGPGISDTSLELLFRPFERLGAEVSGIEGTGLGLALSKGLLEAMGGTLGVRTAVGEGSTFWFELPVATPSVEPRPDELPASGELMLAGPMTVLYIEDNAANLLLVQRALAGRPDTTLLSAEDGAGGLELARTRRPDLILLDLHLPDIPGWDVFRLLRSEPATRDIAVIVVSADATSDRIDRLLAAGVRAYLTKPIDLRRLREAIGEVDAELQARAKEEGLTHGRTPEAGSPMRIRLPAIQRPGETDE